MSSPQPLYVIILVDKRSQALFLMYINILGKVSSEEKATEAVALASLCQYVMWRRWMLVAVLPIALTVSLWGVIDAAKDAANANADADDFEESSSMVRFASKSQLLAFTKWIAISKAFGMAIEIGCLAVALAYSANWKRSRVYLLISAVTPFVVLYLTFLWPIIHYTHFVYNENYVPPQEKDTVDLVNEFGFLVGFIEATYLSLSEVGPSAIALLPSLARGSIVIRLLFPECVDLGWLALAAVYLSIPVFGTVLLMFIQVYLAPYHHSEPEVHSCPNPPCP